MCSVVPGPPPSRLNQQVQEVTSQKALSPSACHPSTATEYSGPSSPLTNQAPCLFLIPPTPLSEAREIFEEGKSDYVLSKWLSTTQNKIQKPRHSLGDSREVACTSPGLSPHFTAPAAGSWVPSPGLPTRCSSHVPSWASHLPVSA